MTSTFRKASRRRPRLRTLTFPLLLASALTVSLAQPPAARAATPAQAPSGSAATAEQDPCGDQCHDILPAGQNGNATLGEILEHRTVGTRPAHSADQLEPYDNLLHDYSGLTEDQLNTYFNDASFGVAPDQVESRISPRDGVTITRDKATGTPHIKGTTRAATEFGAGYAAGQDRLWLMDLLRHVGRGELSSFAGGAESNRELEESLWAVAPYTKDELDAQVQQVRAAGKRGERAYRDITNYLDGINSYLDHAREKKKLPGEYALTGNGKDIPEFEPADVVAIASLIGAIFGSGGGGEVENALAKLEFRHRLGAAKGDAAYAAWRAQNDTEATTTVHGKSFPYANTPKNAEGVAEPDGGTVKSYAHAQNGTGTGEAAKPEADGGKKSPGVLPSDLVSSDRGMSNALVVSGQKTASGHPVAVFGPQTSYYAPQLLMLQELDGPGLRARGASFPGLSFYVELGRGLDYSWSATSANQDITDTFAVRLCEPDGGTPTTGSQHYRLHGKCVPFDELKKRNEWKPTLADSTGRGSYELVTLRSAYGLVTHTGKVKGTPVAFTALRSTYQHEADSVLGFQKFNDPAAVTSASSFQKASQDIGYTFNWFYADADDTAYFNSGTNPVRARHTDPDQPILAEKANEWRGWDPEANTSRVTPAGEHPQAVGQDYFVSWNNKQAEEYAAGWGNGAVHRVDLLDSRVKQLTDAGGVTRTQLVQAMEEAAVTDLRAEQLLPRLLKLLGEPSAGEPELRKAVEQLRAWQKDGGQRKEEAKGDGEYAHADAVRTFDAWWPLLVEGVFKESLGDDLYGALTKVAPINESPSGGQNGSGSSGGGAMGGGAHAGSAFQHGWWSYLDKDLRAVQGEQPGSPLDRTYCGGGDVSDCRDVLRSTLKKAAATPAEETYPGDDECEPGEQVCADALVHRPMGGITVPRVAWQNRPTYQQVVEFPRRR